MILRPLIGAIRFDSIGKTPAPLITAKNLQVQVVGFRTLGFLCNG